MFKKKKKQTTTTNCFIIYTTRVPIRIFNYTFFNMFQVTEGEQGMRYKNELKSDRKTLRFEIIIRPLAVQDE